MKTSDCLMCNLPFTPRVTGGSPQRFCSTTCRRDYDKACRNYVVSELDAGRLSMSELRNVLSPRALV